MNNARAISSASAACQDAEAQLERAFLGAVLWQNDLWTQAKVVPAEVFTLDSHRRIWQTIRSMFEACSKVDVVLLAQRMAQSNDVDACGGIAYLSGLLEHVYPENFSNYIASLRKAALQRRVRRQLELMAGTTDLATLRGRAEQLMELFDSEGDSDIIKRFEQIPELLEMDIPPIRWLIDNFIASGTMVLWAGADGVAKTYLLQRLAIEVASGGSFLGRTCRVTPVLYLDFENPAHAVRERIEAMTESPLTNLRVWGTWLAQQPPQIGDSVLLSISREEKPLLVVDPFRYAHASEENDASDMMAVMKHLRSYAAAGATVIIVHHVSKAEGSGYRGSSAIRAAVDMALLQEQDAGSGVLTLSTTKNRFGPRFSMKVEPDFDSAIFRVADPEFTKHQAELDSIARVIRERPGLSQNDLTSSLPINKKRAIRLVKSQIGIMWDAKTGPRNSLQYFPLNWFPKLETSQKTSEPVGQFSAPVWRFSPLKGETVEPVTVPGTGWTEDIV